MNKGQAIIFTNNGIWIGSLPWFFYHSILIMRIPILLIRLLNIAMGLRSLFVVRVVVRYRFVFSYMPCQEYITLLHQINLYHFLDKRKSDMLMYFFPLYKRSCKWNLHKVIPTRWLLPQIFRVQQLLGYVMTNTLSGGYSLTVNHA